MIEHRIGAKSAVQSKRGTKRTCKNETCCSQYYDLTRDPPACPYCGALCDTPTIIRVDFETLGKQRPRRSNRWVEPAKPLTEVSKAEGEAAEIVDEQDETEPAIPSAAEDLLIEIDDDDEVEAPSETDGEAT